MLPVLAWVPLVVVAILLGASWLAYWTAGVGSPRTLGFLTAWFLLATYLQLFSTSLPFTTTGLVLQAILAIVLIMRVKGQSPVA